ncbi:unnamed protein product, partial [Prorocentrum cordatum]
MTQLPKSAPSPARPPGATPEGRVATFAGSVGKGCSVTGTVAVHQDDSDEEDVDAGNPAGPREELYPPPPVPAPGAPEGAPLLPGPSEEFHTGSSGPREAFTVEHPVQAVQLETYDNDWLVENLTPKLREHILQHFQEDCVTEPTFVPSIGKFVAARFLQSSGSYVSVFMRPQTAIGSDPSATMPVHYNVAKTEILCFIRQCEE